MRSSFTYLGGACAGVALLACAARPPSPTSAPSLTRATLSADGYYALGRNQQAARRDGAALASYEQALLIDPGHVNARNGLAVLYAGRADYGRAIALWRALTAGASDGKAPQRALLLRNLGHAYLLQGESGPAVAALEQACLLDPGHALSWQRLGEALARDGQPERAASMLRQARTLQAHDVRTDYVLLAQSAAPQTPPGGPIAWPGVLARTEVTADGAGMLALRRIAVAAVPAAAPAAAPIVAAETLSRPASAAPVPRLEIRNGNGVRGMAGALGRLIGGERLQVIRLGNAPHFLVARSRIEYAPQWQAEARALAQKLGALDVRAGSEFSGADLRVVLGHDLDDVALVQRRYLKQARLARPEPG